MRRLATVSAGVNEQVSAGSISRYTKGMHAPLRSGLSARAHIRYAAVLRCRLRLPMASLFPG